MHSMRASKDSKATVNLSKGFSTSFSKDLSDDPERPSYRASAGSAGVMGGKDYADTTHRTLKSRHIQLIGIGGTIGTVLFVQIGQPLLEGGPGSLFIAFTFWCTVILAITISVAEYVTYLPISSPFIRFSGRFVDDALEFAGGWNYFVFEAALVPFEVTACNLIINFWSDAVPVAAIITIVICCYATINLFTVRWYGESEFWAALGKVLLAIGLIFYTLITMLGGNPQHDRFGFRYWRDPGSFAELYYTGNLGRWLGFLQCLILASFTIAGPDYVSMTAGEAENPRSVLPKAFNSVFYRLTAFFVLGSLCIGINVPYNSPELEAAFKNNLPGAAASPYVVAMRRLGIPALPDIVNALVLTAAFSAGNSYVYCASRSLLGLALEGKAPAIFAKTTKRGVPIYSVLLVLAFALLSFLQVSNNSSVVLDWFVNLVTASQLINFSVMMLTFIKWHGALKAQGVDRNKLPYRGRCQPFLAWYALIWCSIMAVVGGYPVFLPGRWSVPTFLFSYTMVFITPLLFIGWKLVKNTKWRRAEEVDLTSGLEEIEEYTQNWVPLPPRNTLEKYGDKIAGALHLW